MQNARHVRCDKGLALAHADHHRRPRARHDDLVRLGRRKNAQRKGAGQQLHCPPHRILKLDWLARCLGIFLHLLDQVRNDLGVGLGNELVALADQLVLQLQVVLHNAVVHHHDSSRAVAMRMGILFRGSAMCGPAGMANAKGAFERVAMQHFFKVAQLPGSAANTQRGARWAADCNTRRVVTAIFEAP